MFKQVKPVYLRNRDGEIDTAENWFRSARDEKWDINFAIEHDFLVEVYFNSATNEWEQD